MNQSDPSLQSFFRRVNAMMFRLTTLRGLPGEATAKEAARLNWKTADLLEATLPLQGGETLLNTVDLGQNLVQTLAPVCLPYSPEFAPDRPDRGRLALAALPMARRA